MVFSGGGGGGGGFFQSVDHIAVTSSLRAPCASRSSTAVCHLARCRFTVVVVDVLYSRRAPRTVVVVVVVTVVASSPLNSIALRIFIKSYRTRVHCFIVVVVDVVPALRTFRRIRRDFIGFFLATPTPSQSPFSLVSLSRIE